MRRRAREKHEDALKLNRANIENMHKYSDAQEREC